MRCDTLIYIACHVCCVVAVGAMGRLYFIVFLRRLLAHEHPLRLGYACRRPLRAL